MTGRGEEKPWQAVLAYLMEAGYERAEPSILQPISVFIEQSGEDLRARLYEVGSSYQPQESEALCLRPEYTIPVCRDYLNSSAALQRKSYCYMGSIFRRPEWGEEGEKEELRVGEFIQAGIEKIGDEDRATADAEVMYHILQAAKKLSPLVWKIRLSDAGLLNHFLSLLGLSPFWLRRVRYGLSHGRSVTACLQVPEWELPAPYGELLALWQHSGQEEVERWVQSLLSLESSGSAAPKIWGGRSVAEIAERLLEQASVKAEKEVTEEKNSLEEFLNISGSLEEATQKLRQFAQTSGFLLKEYLDVFEARVEALARFGLPLAEIEFSNLFVQKLDYYTGVIFEAVGSGSATRDSHARKVFIRGGRYDSLIRQLGATHPVTAVGAAIQGQGCVRWKKVNLRE